MGKSGRGEEGNQHSLRCEMWLGSIRVGTGMGAGASADLLGSAGKKKTTFYLEIKNPRQAQEEIPTVSWPQECE